MREELKSFMAGPTKSSLLLCGNTGLPMLTDALELAGLLLNTPIDKLSTHPDYLFIDKGGEKSIGVEQSDLLIAKANLLPAVAECNIIVIDGFDAMTVQAQNKLLKTIEENSSVLIIAVVYNADSVLETIKSRMRVVEYHPLDRMSFMNYCKEHDLPDAAYFYYASGGCPENTDCSHLTNLYKDIGECIRLKNIPRIYSLLHLVKEKDKGNFYQVGNALSLFTFFGAFVTDCLCLVQNNFSESYFGIRDVVCDNNYLQGCSKCITKAMEHSSIPNYSQDNFFKDILDIFEH